MYPRSSVVARVNAGLREPTTPRTISGPRTGRVAPGGRGCGAALRLLDGLDPVAVRVADEADPRATRPYLVRRLLGLDAALGQRGELAVEVVDGQRDVVVARADLV